MQVVLNVIRCTTLPPSIRIVGSASVSIHSTQSMPGSKQVSRPTDTPVILPYVQYRCERMHNYIDSQPLLLRHPTKRARALKSEKPLQGEEGESVQRKTEEEEKRKRWVEERERERDR